MSKKVLTLAYLIREGEICLALKKRGFGVGNWNGYGGKLEEGEMIESGAIREIFEESTVRVEKEYLDKVARVEFFFTDGTHLEVHTFFIRIWAGEPTETEEMSPRWFQFTDIPYEHMWADDIHWLPQALKGEKLIGKVWFEDDGKSIKKMEWESVTEC